jgi:uncharacterized membrane protein YdjX (TVP38/TMEM64 family)
MKSLTNRLLAGLVVLVGIVLLRFTPVYNLITFENIVYYSSHLENYVTHHYQYSVLLFCLAYIVVAVLSLPVASVLTVLGGFLFGIVWGTFYSVISFVIGASCSFLAFRYFFGSSIQEKYRDKLVRFNQNVAQYGSSYLLMLNFFTIIPAFFINIFAAVTHISFITFVWTTFIGTIPGQLVYAFAGRQLGSIHSMSDILEPRILLAFGLLVLLALLPIIFKINKK